VFHSNGKYPLHAYRVGGFFYRKYNLFTYTLTMKTIKDDFPIFKNNPDLIYLDSASTLMKPQVVIDAVSDYLSQDYANIHRGNYDLSLKSEELYEQARSTVAKFIWANDESEVIFTSNSTDSVNILAQSLLVSQLIKKGDNIVVSELEHHANALPRQLVAERTWAELRWIPVGIDGVLDVELVKKNIDSNTKIIALSACSNVTGRVWLEEVWDLSRRLNQSLGDGWSWTPLSAPQTSPLERGEENSPLAPRWEGGKRSGSFPWVVVDASQAVVHEKIDVREMGCDFCFFTWHKLGALTGIGVLWWKKEHLKVLKPGKVGGGAVEQVTATHVQYLASPDKFEPGTPNVVGAISLGVAIEYLEKERQWEREESAVTDRAFVDSTLSFEEELKRYCLEQFRLLEDTGKITLLGGYEAQKKIGVFSFVPHGVSALAIDQAMGREGIAIRTGAHCTHIYHTKLTEDPSCMLEKSVRMSFWMYTEMSDVERFFEVLKVALWYRL